MRVIGGEFRGRILRMPKGVKIRPTQDRTREAVFNIIRQRVPESAVLDLYAGSGAFGIEALSRGAQSALFVDNNIKCMKAIKNNLLVLGDRPNLAELLKYDSVKAISRLGKEGRRFDIVFLDPPYYGKSARNCLINIDACDILSPRGIVIAEHFKKDEIPEETPLLRRFERRKYGDTAISFYCKQ